MTMTTRTYPPILTATSLYAGVRVRIWLTGPGQYAAELRTPGHGLVWLPGFNSPERARLAAWRRIAAGERDERKGVAA